MNIDISQLDKAHVLCALYNRATSQGVGRLHYIAGPMKYSDAQVLLKKANYFDYVLGRVMKVEIKEGQEFLDPQLYDRDNGDGAAEKAIVDYFVDNNLI